MANISARLSIVKNVFKSVFNLNKKSFLLANTIPSKISNTQAIFFSKNLLKNYTEIINWNREEIPPLFPYVLSTHIHFELVNDKRFPFSPYGLLHKKEQIWCKKSLTYNSNWSITAFIETYRILENGIEFDLVSELTIEGELVWKSTTTAFKRLKQKERSSKPADTIDTEKGILIDVPAYYGRKYASISNNIDPIHISTFLAKLQGHKTAIMYGMWAMARSLSEIKEIKYPLNIISYFKASIPIPSKIVMLKKKEDNVQYISVYSSDAKVLYAKVEVGMG